MNNIEKNLGSNVKKYREIKKMSRKELAYQMKISESNLTKIENGEIKKSNIDNIINIANVLDIKIDSLAYDVLSKYDNTIEDSLIYEIENELDKLDENQLEACFEILKILTSK